MTELNRFLRLDQVREVTGLPTSSVYQLMEDEQFPKQIKLGKRSVAWLESDIVRWQQARIEAAAAAEAPKQKRSRRKSNKSGVGK